MADEESVGLTMDSQSDQPAIVKPSLNKIEKPNRSTTPSKYKILILLFFILFLLVFVFYSFVSKNKQSEMNKDINDNDENDIPVGNEEEFVPDTSSDGEDVDETPTEPPQDDEKINEDEDSPLEEDNNQITGEEESAGIDEEAPPTDHDELSVAKGIHEAHLHNIEERCDPTKPQPRKGTNEYELLSADCGLGYDPSTPKIKPWRVSLYGPSFQNDKIWARSGCLAGARCPLTPDCYISKGGNDIHHANVVVIFQDDFQLISEFPKEKRGKNQYLVVYWREAYWTIVPPYHQEKFDFEMGIHWQSAILNPDFQFTPSQLLGGVFKYGVQPKSDFMPALKRKHFALSIISHCHARSGRDFYIAELLSVLGAERIHQYGRCGNRKLPPPPLQNAVKVIENYKFFLSFENMIQDGYVTEKLFAVLSLPIVPIYYGHPNTPNITLTPSFLKASDFRGPKDLGKYLMFLDENEEEYEKYHAWRFTKKSFHPEYLKLMQDKFPGAYEMEMLRKNVTQTRVRRTASCCRLCDSTYVENAKKSRNHLVTSTFDHEMIRKTFFKGT